MSPFETTTASFVYIHFETTNKRECPLCIVPLEGKQIFNFVTYYMLAFLLFICTDKGAHRISEVEVEIHQRHEPVKLLGIALCISDTNMLQK